MIDLRSDTVTKPSPAMLDAMFHAQVGDDVFKEDPTVNALEEKTAKLFGHEAGLFCPSGTMTNQIAIKVHTQPGDEVLCDVTAHIYNYEGGGISLNSSAQAKLIPGDRGRIAAKQVEESINPNFDWLTRTRLVSIENTANRAGGSYYSLEQMREIGTVCKKHELRYHLDGARIFHAILEGGYSSLEVGAQFDSVSVCLSKGLGAPAGSVLIGSEEFIRQARRVRKVFGGGMRQAGYLAAAGIFALDNNISRLKEDHARAKVIAQTLSQLSYIDSILPVDTNIIIFNLNEKLSPEKFVKQLFDNGIKATGFGKQAIRFVTHLDFTDEMLEKTVRILRSIQPA
ncbi:MAG: aminotransferase class I/II-fold pyridoxal phosphate-dependent enzyme [Bacteroidetes bacterium]|nr:aminotransferase class I/II-fold pyridoxal phosphate-dependent enzyme [Bacteroidota bacterium]